MEIVAPSTINTFFSSLTLASILPALILLVICLAVMKVLLKALDQILGRSKLDKSLHPIIHSTVKILLIFVTIMLVAEKVGINTSSLLAVLSIAGVAVSLSIQNILSNFFSGVTLLMSKPFKVGDFVTAGGQSGTIVETGITHTKLHTPDNQVILVPNSAVTSNVIINVSTEDKRRVDFTLTASYSSKPEKVLAALKEAADVPQVLDQSETFARISGYGDHSVQYTLRVWVNNADYWDTYFGILERVQPCYEKHGVEMNYPHINVHTN